MIYLFTGRSGILSPLLAAGVYLGKDMSEDWYFWASNEYNREGVPVFVGFDAGENRVYVMRAKNYWLLPVICEELEKAAGRDKSSLKVIPVEISGEKVLRLLYRIAMKLGLGKGGEFLLRKWWLRNEAIVKDKISKTVG